MVELRQVSEHSCEAGIVGAAAHHPHGKDGVTSHRGVAVVRELAQCVEDGELGVGGGEEGQCQGNSTSNNRVSIVELQGGRGRGTAEGERS